jgi:uncharacterized protein YaaR (DUF327 family)
MKIGEAGGQYAEFPHQKKVKGKPAAAGARGARGAGRTEGEKQDVEFKDAYLNAADSTLKSGLDEMMGQLQAQGERLARHQNFEELSKYKDLVRAFLAKASKDLYQLRPSDGGASQASRPGSKIYVVLQKVDEELEKLAKLVLAGQAPQLRILEKLDQIKGLLMDAYK